MALEPQQRVSIQEYLAFERQSETRHEYLDGKIFSMPGATLLHGVIAGNIFGLIWTQLRRRPCEAYQNSMRVRTPNDLFAYPDVVAVCGEPSFNDAELDTLLNPALIVEVISLSTKDCGTRLTHYRAIPSLTDYLLVTQDRTHVEHWNRGAADWFLVDLDDLGQTIELHSIGCRLALADVYEKVLSE